MLWIGVKGLAERYYRNLELLAGLFFEEVKVQTAIGEEEHTVEFEIVKESNFYRTEATLSVPTEDIMLQERFERELEVDLTEKEREKRLKQTISAAFLLLYQEYTKIEQPWGILTGVRPVKLYHMMREKGPRMA